MLTTQIRGLLERIAEGQEESMEETARLLAQALVGEGRIVSAVLNELEAVTATALDGVEPLNGAIRYTKELELTTAIASCCSCEGNYPVALELARELADQFIPFAVMAADKEDDDNELQLFCVYVYFDRFEKGSNSGSYWRKNRPAPCACCVVCIRGSEAVD